ncbi:hypothetical protein IC620_12145 [Hazenella sp. IB182357]|uniref:Uncharacterized protein n=1 Tax=Polycladospora coralii TaxID=2771432 RepID=A0A926NC59_9BACL|nr:YncE family protein [Polycladospora coralii]MBD1373105.1 hypothetical protein [Polycladospora coralii]MBS7531663.1 hypothetical protein [Polycladospora coralii]
MPFVYVSNFSSNSVSVIDIKTNDVIANISVGNQPAQMIVTPNGQYVYVWSNATGASGVIFVIDTKTHAIISSIFIDETVSVDIFKKFAVSPDGQFVYVTRVSNNLAEMALVVIDTKTNFITAKVRVGDTPLSPVVLPNGKFIYVINNGVLNLSKSSISVIETKTYTITSTIDFSLGIIPSVFLGVDLIVAPNGKLVYALNAVSTDVFGSVSVIETKTNTIVATIEVGLIPHTLAVSPDGKFIYVVNSFDGNLNGSVSVIETKTHTIVATIDVGLLPVGIAINPNGQYIYVVNNISIENKGSVSVIDTNHFTVISTITVDFSPTAISITPDGQYIYVVNTGNFIGSPNNKISVIETKTNTVIATVAVGDHPSAVAIVSG